MMMLWLDDNASVENGKGEMKKCVIWLLEDGKYFGWFQWELSREKYFNFMILDS